MNISQLLNNIVLALIILLPSNAFSQKQNVSIQLENGTLQEVLTSIRIQTGLDYILNDDIISPHTKASLVVKNVPVDDALDILFTGSQVWYTIKDNTIIVTPKKKVSRIQYLVISGVVADFENENLTLPSAHIRIKNTNIGCITNTEGEFQFKIHPKYRDSVLMVSFVSYESYEGKIDQLIKKENRILLKPVINEISEVVVKPPDAIEILAKAVHNFKQNYWQEPINAEAFYREILFQDGKAKRMAETACEYYLEPFKHKYTEREFNKEFDKSSSFGNLDNAVFLPLAWHPQPPTNQVKIIEARSSYDASNTGMDFCLYGGPMLPIHYDFVNNNYPANYINDFVEERTFDKTYKRLQNGKGRLSNRIGENPTISHSEWEGRPIYIIKDGGLTIYVDKESYAIIQYKLYTRYYPGKFYLTRMNKSIKKYKSKRDAMTSDSSYIEVKYFENQGKWYYRSITVNRYATYIPKKGDHVKISTTRQVMFNSVQTENVKPFDNDETFKNRYNSSLHYYATEYNPYFWNQYNTLYPTTLQQDIKKTLEKNLPLEAQFASRFDYDKNMKPPVAKIIFDTLSLNGEHFPDNYNWLNSDNEDSIKAYVLKENKYADNYFLQHSSLIRGLSNEMSDIFEFTPYKLKQSYKKIIGNYTYYINDSIGRLGAICRKDISGKIDTLIDFDEKTKFALNYMVDWFDANPDNSVFCYREYPYGDEEYHLIFMNIETKTNIDTINALTCKWVTNNIILNLERIDDEYYNRRLFCRNIDSAQSTLLYQTSIDNSIFYLESESKEYVFINIGSTAGIDSVFFIKKNVNPELNLLVSAKKCKEYKVEHFNDEPGFYINTNENVDKWCLYKADETNYEKENWELIIPEDKEREIKLIGKIDSLLILSSLKGITNDILFYNEKTRTLYDDLTFPDEYHTVSVIKANSPKDLLISYDTYLSPRKYYRYNFIDKTLDLMGSDTVLNYDQSQYAVKIENVKSRDKETIPVVLIYNKKAKKKIGKSPVLLETYGGGNINYNPGFRVNYLPILERGFILGFALVRGSAELGNDWRDKAVQKNVAISGDDFADVAKHLIDKNITSPDKLFAYGISHGGFVMSYVANNYPELFNGIISDVPYGDLLTELSDSTNAMNRFDYHLHGSPYVANEFEELKRICPYQNIKKQNYPNMMYFAGWLDINVNPMIAVKQVAKLRANKTDDNLLLLRVLMSSGHGTSGEKYYIQQAWMYTFMMKCMEK